MLELLTLFLEVGSPGERHKQVLLALHLLISHLAQVSLELLGEVVADLGVFAREFEFVGVLAAHVPHSLF